MIGVSIILRGQNLSFLDCAVADESELLVDSATEGHFFAHFRTNGIVEFHFHDVLNHRCSTS